MTQNKNVCGALIYSHISRNSRELVMQFRRLTCGSVIYIPANVRKSFKPVFWSYPCTEHSTRLFCKLFQNIKKMLNWIVRTQCIHIQISEGKNVHIIFKSTN